MNDLCIFEKNQICFLKLEKFFNYFILYLSFFKFIEGTFYKKLKDCAFYHAHILF